MPTPNLVSLSVFGAALIVDARYASANNVLGRPLYDSAELFLLPAAIASLQRAVDRLAPQGLKLKVWDAYRPQSAQEALWERFPDPAFVTPPEVVSPHTRGCAIDLTLVQASGAELPMPTAFDHFGPEAHTDYPDLPAAVLANRAKLATAMVEAGFEPIPTEWWHFHLPNWRDLPAL